MTPKFMTPACPNVVTIEQDLGPGLTSSRDQSFPVYPSVKMTVPNSLYNDAAEALCEASSVPCIYFDGEFITVPESYTDVIQYLEAEFKGVVIERGTMQKHEFATLAIQAGVSGNLVSLGDAIAGLDGTAQEMLQKALSSPEQALLDWRGLYLASMDIH